MNISFDSSDDGAGREELFTPIRGGRKSLMPDFSPTPSRSATTDESTTPAPKQKNPKGGNSTSILHQSSTSFFADNTPLPNLQNSSWLGADMSPIRKGSDENNLNDVTVNEDGDAALVAPYGLGLAETGTSASTSSVAPSESFFVHANDDTDDLEENNNNNNNSKEQTPKRATNRTKNGGSTGTPKTRVREMPFARVPSQIPFLFRPRTSGTPTLGEANHPSGNPRRRRRKLLNPFGRTFWSSSSPSQDDTSSTYVMVDLPSRWAANGSLRMFLGRGNRYVIGATGLVLFCIGIHDGFLAYLAMRRGDDSLGTYGQSQDGLAWTLPWLGPTQGTLLRFGAFCPERILKASSSSSAQYWRTFTSMVVPISVVEWLVLVWVWTKYLPSKLLSPVTNMSWQLSWPVVYLLSSLTGQLWMMAFHYETMRLQQFQNAASAAASSLPSLSGCAGWATAGVLCAVGIQAPNRRFPCFVSCIALVLLHQFQVTGSVIGCSAAAFFGWAYSGLWSHYVSQKRWREQQLEMLHRDLTYYYDALDRETARNQQSQWNLWHVFAAIILFLLWFSPIVFLLYR